MLGIAEAAMGLNGLERARKKIKYFYFVGDALVDGFFVVPIPRATTFYLDVRLKIYHHHHQQLYLESHSDRTGNTND